MPTLRFPRPSATPTLSRIAPPLEDVFASRHAEHARWFLPLLSVDLSEVDPAWSGVAHFVYYDAYEERLTFRIVNGRYEYDGDYSECNPHDEIEGRLVPGFVELAPLEIPDKDGVWTVDPIVAALVQSIWKGDPKYAQAAADYAYWETMEAWARKRVDGRASVRCRFGGVPRWTQSDETPRNGKGEPMRFVGQVKATELGSRELADFDFFLFVDVEERIAVQISQCT